MSGLRGKVGQPSTLFKEDVINFTVPKSHPELNAVHCVYVWCKPVNDS